MCIGHDQDVVTEARHHATGFGSFVNRRTFMNLTALTDDDLRSLTLKLQVLGVTTDHGTRKITLSFPIVEPP